MFWGIVENSRSFILLYIQIFGVLLCAYQPLNALRSPTSRKQVASRKYTAVQSSMWYVVGVV